MLLNNILFCLFYSVCTCTFVISKSNELTPTTMKATELKKGMRVVEFGPYNFLSEQWKERESNETDEYSYHVWNIHSVGKVLLRLEDEEGLKTAALRSWNGEFARIALSLDDVKRIIDERRAKYGYEPNSYIIADHRIDF